MRPKYSFGLDGPSAFSRPAADVQGEILEPFFDSHEWEYARDYFTEGPAMYVNRKPTAIGGLEVFGIIVGFIGTCFAKKIFDEVYERTLKRPIGAFLDALFQKPEVPAGKVVEYRDVIRLEDIDLVVVVRTLVTKESTSDVQATVMHGHRVAHAFIESHGKKAPVHCHTIKGGQIPSEPELFESLEQIKQKDRADAKPRWGQ